jgi:hypothetical protein
LTREFVHRAEAAGPAACGMERDGIMMCRSFREHARRPLAAQVAAADIAELLDSTKPCHGTAYGNGR